MPALTLKPDARRALRAEAHALDPVVQIGAQGLTDAVTAEVDRALSAHGLIKVRAALDDREAREAAYAALTEALGAAPVQHIGKLLVLWRPKPKPDAAAEAEAAERARGAGPKVVKVVKFSKSGSHRAIVKKVRVLGNQRVTRAGTVKRKDVRQVSSKKKAGA